MDSNPWEEFVKRAQAYVNTGQLERQEVKYKLDIGVATANAREAVLRSSDDWQNLLKRALPPNHPISWRALSDFRSWYTQNSDEALSALQAIWTKNDSSIAERIRAFTRDFPRGATRGAKGIRTTIVSALLMGWDVSRCPPFKTQAFNKAYERTGYAKPGQNADEAALYEHALGFLDRFIKEASERRLTLKDRLEAQSVVWHIRHECGCDVCKIARAQQVAGDEESEVDDALGTDASIPRQLDMQSLAGETFLPEGFLEDIEMLLKEKKQVIFQGPPGTGKTHVALALAEHLAGSKEWVTLVQLHPSYAYEDFVQGFRPSLIDGLPGFHIKDGPMLRAAKRAREEPDEDHFLVIDEINRGNPAKVFGELYFLLEYRDREMVLQYSNEPFSLPENLYIIGTMNTADRSIALVDLALRRRFYFVEFHPDDEPVKGVLRRWLEANAPGMDWLANVVERTNEKMQDDRHAAIGPSYFMKDGLDDDAVKRIWKHSVLPYIEERRYGEGDLSGFGLKELRTEVRRVGGENDEAQEQGEPGATNEGSGAQ